jgi:hypothetical protein
MSKDTEVECRILASQGSKQQAKGSKKRQGASSIRMESDSCLAMQAQESSSISKAGMQSAWKGYNYDLSFALMLSSNSSKVIGPPPVSPFTDSSKVMRWIEPRFNL